MNPDIEKVIDMHPDGILLSPYENSGGYGRIEKLNIPILECADYMETSALGRAEWVHFYGLLFGKEAEADSLFAGVEEAYLSLRNQVKDITPKPTVITELKPVVHGMYRGETVQWQNCMPMPGHGMYLPIFLKAVLPLWLLKQYSIKDSTPISG